MLESTLEKARELGRLLGQTEEYGALGRARERVENDRELVGLINRLAEIEQTLAASLRRGEAPTDEVRNEYEQVFSSLQASAVYQGLVAAQANFDKVLGRVNEEIGNGMEAASKSRIILPS